MNSLWFSLCIAKIFSNGASYKTLPLATVFIIRKTKPVQKEFSHLFSRLKIKSNGIELIVKFVDVIHFIPDSCHVGKKE